MKLAYPFNLLLCELRHWVVLSIAYRRRAVPQSPFGLSISTIVQRCAKKQVVRIAAWPIVAFVKDVFSFWNWTYTIMVSCSMGTRVLPVHLPLSVPGVHSNRLLPWPTMESVPNLHVSPKSFFWRRFFGPFVNSTFKSPFNSLSMSFHGVYHTERGVIWQ